MMTLLHFLYAYMYWAVYTLVGLIGIATIVAGAVARARPKWLKRYVREQGWTIVGFEPAATGASGSGRIKLRYRDEGGLLHAAVVAPEVGGSGRCEASREIPAQVARAMTDTSLPMGCRKCGATIPRFSDRCPHCGTVRNALLGPGDDEALGDERLQMRA